MIRLSLITTVLFLTGCAGVVEMRQEDPYATYASAKSPDVIAACVSEAWTTQPVMPLAITPDVRINPITGGAQVMIYNSGVAAPDAFADMLNDGTGTKITYYAKHRERFRRGYGALIEGCL